MFGEEHIESRGNYWDAKSSIPAMANRPNRLKYQDEYVANIKIVKTEPDATAANGRAPVTYILENAYPYAIDAVPLSYGTSQITRVNVNFHYARHSVIYGGTPKYMRTNDGLDYDDPAKAQYGLLDGRGG